FFFFQAEDGIRDKLVTGVQTCALPILFSADPIPGNEVNINALIDTLSKKEARVVYSEITDRFHVSGHGAQNDLKLLVSLTNPRRSEERRVGKECMSREGA